MKQILHRLYKLFYAFLIGLGIITARLAQLQISRGAVLSSLSINNYLRTEEISSPRGNIIDRFGRLLVTSKPIIMLSWQGSGNSAWSDEQQKLLSFLEETVHDSFAESAELRRAEKLCRTHVLAEDVPVDLLAKIIELVPTHKNLSVTTTYKRFYPHKSTGCHVVGYLSSFSNQGTMGLEKLFDELLRGTPGLTVRTINSFGRHIEESEQVAACKGNDIATTIDLDLQLLAEEVFPADSSGCFIIMNAQNGSLHAIVSRPGFDPNEFLQPISHETWQNFQKKTVFLNRAFCATYPPASLFKLITTAAALEENIVQQEQQWFCPGYTTYAGRTYFCNKHEGHGKLSLKQALAKSCNIPFYDIARTIKIDTLSEYAHRLGLGEKTSVALPERSGLVPSSSWKREKKGEPWWPGETLSAVIGQSYLLVTPVQIARMISGICQGYLVKPRILQEEAIEQTPIEMDRATLEFLQQSMKSVIADGSARRLKQFSSITIYAKTGTAQVRTRESCIDESSAPLPHAWLAAQIQYANHEPLILVIFLEHAGLSTAPTAVAASFLKQYKKLMDGKESNNEEIAQ